MANRGSVHGAAALSRHRLCLELLPAACGRAVPLDQYRYIVGVQPEHLLPWAVVGLGQDQPRQDWTTQAGHRRRPALRRWLCPSGGRARAEESDAVFTWAMASSQGLASAWATSPQ